MADVAAALDLALLAVRACVADPSPASAQLVREAVAAYRDASDVELARVQDEIRGRHAHDDYCALLGCADTDHDEPGITRDRVLR